MGFQNSARALSTNRSAYAFARGLRGRIFKASMPVLATTASNEAVNCPARSWTRNRKSAARSPRSIRRLRICCVVHGPSGFAVTPRMCTPGADLDHEQAVQALKGHRAVHVEEVSREHRRGLRAQELPPCRVGAPL